MSIFTFVLLVIIFILFCFLFVALDNVNRLDRNIREYQEYIRYLKNDSELRVENERLHKVIVDLEDVVVLYGCDAELSDA